LSASCKDCGSTTRRLSRPGPRCATCHRTRKAASKRSAHSRHLELTYGITREEYDRIYQEQGGVCAICQRATGRTRSLSVDHDHSLGSGRNSIRGLLCRPDNSYLGHIRDDPAMLQRAIDYLAHPPARRVLRDEC
jgi:hypothetical protein